MVITIKLGVYNLMTHNQFPPGWNQEKVEEVKDYYENITEEEAVFEDEFEYAYSTLDELIQEGTFDDYNREHRILIGTLITNYNFDKDRAEGMLQRVKRFHDATK